MEREAFEPARVRSAAAFALRAKQIPCPTYLTHLTYPTHPTC